MRKRLKLRALAMAALAAIAVAVPVSSPAAGPVTVLPLRLGAMTIDTSAEAFYALDEGFFTAAGLDVTLTILNNGSAIAAALSAGALDIGFGSPTPVLMAHLSGLPIGFIAPATAWDGRPNAVIMVPKGSSIHSAADLSHKTVAVAGNSALVQFLELPYAQMGLALQQGRVAAAVVIQPFSAQMSADATVLGNDTLTLKSYLQSGWFAMGSYVEKNPEAARRFALVMRQTARWANTHPKETAAILARYTKVDPAQMATWSRPHYVEDARVDPQLIQPVIDVMVRYGNVTPVPASDLIWPAFR
jgi:NitT/TauT family transport system substrate-binding protein